MEKKVFSFANTTPTKTIENERNNKEKKNENEK